jgi:predicted nucleic acid-binding protein
MHPYRLDVSAIELDRGTVLLDTNVVVAYHSPRDGRDGDRHRAAVAYVNTVPALAVTDAVLAEAWGLMTKGEEYPKEERYHLRQQMLDWVAEPSSGVVVVPDIPDAIGPISVRCRERSLDVVDVLLADLAHRLSTANEGLPLFPVATFDTGDLTRLLEFYTFEVIDPRSPPE